MDDALRTVLPPLALAVALLLAVATAPDAPAPVDDEPATAPPAAPPPAAIRTIALPPPPGPPLPVAVPAAAPVRVVRPTVADIERGRAALDRIAKGDGPTIEFGWPDDPAARRRLLRYLVRCAGWRPLLLADGRLWRAEDPAGRPWTPTPEDPPSGLLRDLDGPAADSAAAAAIRARHRLSGGRPVATVARRWDARLLGGLGRLLGADWAAAKGGGIRARYVIDGARLSMADIRVDGRLVPGRVDLGPVARCGR